MKNEQDGLLNILRHIPDTETPTIKTVTICVQKSGVVNETHELMEGDSICSILFDLSLVGGLISDLSWNFNWQENDWNRLNVRLDIVKTGTGNSNITADVIEMLLVKLGFIKGRK